MYDLAQSVRKWDTIIQAASHHPLKSHIAIHESIPIIRECNHKSLPLTEYKTFFCKKNLIADKNRQKCEQ